MAKGNDKQRRRKMSVHDQASSLPRVWDDPTLRKMVVPVEGADLEPLASVDPEEPPGAKAGSADTSTDQQSTGLDEPSEDSVEEMTAAEVGDLPTANLEWIGDSMDDDDERRAQPRIAVSGGVRVTINGQQFVAEGVDVSRGGISFQPAPYWVKKGDPVMIEMGERPVTQTVLGRVAWRRRLKSMGDQLQIGVRFSRPLEDEPSVDFFRRS